MTRFFTLFIAFVFSLSLPAQQTVGLFINDSLSFNGYTLFNATNSRTTYLIDNCGFIVKTWESEYNPGMSFYLLENGNLLRTGRVASSFTAGGTGGRVELFNWEGDLLWGYNHSNEDFHQHHDVEPLVNGNFLIIAWEKYSQLEAIEAGRNPAQVTESGVWSEHIMELKPLGTDSVEIIWEWHAWDHLIQDFDSTKANYGVVAEHPELFDINFTNGGATGRDWLHFNSVDYNPALDQILVSSRHWSEFFIIDRSTTSAEAATNQGGVYGKGGNILYRWGNPQTYGHGDSYSQKTYGQHDVQWIEEGLEGAGRILFFNNGAGRPGGAFSTVESIEVPMNGPGEYFLEADSTFGPSGPVWSYFASPANSFYSSRISGVQRLPNGHTLICEGTKGHFFEIDHEGNVYWDYISPVTGQGRIAQGDPVNNGNDVFRAYRYGPDYPAFGGRDLMPGELVERDPWDLECEIHGTITSLQNLQTPGLSVFPNPVSDELTVEWSSGEEMKIEIFDVRGRKMKSDLISGGSVALSLQRWPEGLYFLKINDTDIKKIIVQRY